MSLWKSHDRYREIRVKKNKIIFDMIWRFAERCAVQGVTFFVSILLARLLSPEEYGTVALVMVFITIMETFIWGSFDTALIQKKDADHLDFSTVFYFQIVFCSISCIVLFCSAPFIAGFYKNPELTTMIRVLGCKLIFVGLYSVQCSYTARNRQFKKFFYCNLAGAMTSAVIGVIMACLGFGAWALIGQNITTTFVAAIVLWTVVDFRPRWEFSIARLQGLFSYGWKILVGNLLETGYMNLRNLMIGKWYSATNLGYYTKGEQFPKLIISNINTSIDSVLLATMSHEQDDKNRVKSMTRKSIKTSSYIIWPCMIGLCVSANPLVELILTEKWLPIVPYLRIFCLTYGFLPMNTANLSAIKAIGHSAIFLKIQIIKKSIGVIFILLAVQFGVFAIAIVGIFATIIETIVNAVPNKKLINYSYTQQMADIFPSIVLAIMMGICIWWIQYLSMPLILILVLQVILGMGVYIFLSLIFKMDSFFYLWNKIKDIMDKK